MSQGEIMKFVVKGYVTQYGERFCVFTSDPYDTEKEAQMDADEWPCNFGESASVDEDDET